MLPWDDICFTGILLLNRFLAVELLRTFELWYLVAVLGANTLCMADVFYFDERAASVVALFFSSILYVEC